MLVGGIDEAGRGCVLGPLVVAGACIDDAALDDLRELGVKDSKVLTRAKRSVLYGDILRVSNAVVTLEIHPDEIDQYVKLGKKYRKLNYLEAMYMARIVDLLKAEKTYIDAADTNPLRFSREICELIHPGPEIVAEHRADSNYPIVSAASIVAKVERDRAVEKLRERYGDFGSGYPHDPRTISFLKEWVRKEGSRPSFSRKSWKSWARIEQESL